MGSQRVAKGAGAHGARAWTDEEPQPRAERGPLRGREVPEPGREDPRVGRGDGRLDARERVAGPLPAVRQRAPRIAVPVTVRFRRRAPRLLQQRARRIEPGGGRGLGGRRRRGVADPVLAVGVPFVLDGEPQGPDGSRERGAGRVAVGQRLEAAPQPAADDRHGEAAPFPFGHQLLVERRDHQPRAAQAEEVLGHDGLVGEGAGGEVGHLRGSVRPPPDEHAPFGTPARCYNPPP